MIDSVVRQSRHQFGANKDVFAARFTKNIVNTFQNLFKCPPDEKVSIEIKGYSLEVLSKIHVMEASVFHIRKWF